MLRKILCILSFLAVGLVQGQQLSLSNDTNQVRFGEHFTSTLKVDIEASKKEGDLILPDSIQDYFPNLEILSVALDTQSTQYKDGFTMHYLFHFTLAGFDSGSFEQGPIPVLHNGDSLFSSSTFINVYPVAVDTSTQVKDIKANIDIPLAFTDYVKAYYHYPLAFIILLLVAYAVYRWVKNRKKTSVELEIEKPAPIIPAHVEAKDALNQLLKEKAWESLGVKEYYSRITYITRRYLGRRYEVNALEHTSSELSAMLKYKLKTGYLQADLTEILNLADMVKFAKEKPDDHFAKESLEKALKIVEKTTPIEDESNE